jgi:hypothetical protein
MRRFACVQNIAVAGFLGRLGSAIAAAKSGAALRPVCRTAKKLLCARPDKKR